MLCGFQTNTLLRTNLQMHSSRSSRELYTTRSLLSDSRQVDPIHQTNLGPKAMIKQTPTLLLPSPLLPAPIRNQASRQLYLLSLTVATFGALLPSIFSSLPLAVLIFQFPRPGTMQSPRHFYFLRWNAFDNFKIRSDWEDQRAPECPSRRQE